MLSVLAHTGGDTLRTLAALAAAATATATGESGTLCDAWACILVTLTIVFLVIPLLSAIFKAYVKERNEASMLE
jgi:Co/Zn/Cd efflux system component